MRRLRQLGSATQQPLPPQLLMIVVVVSHAKCPHRHSGLLLAGDRNTCHVLNLSGCVRKPSQDEAEAVCGVAGACHTFLDEISDALKRKPETMPRSEGKATYSFPWMYEHAAWKK